MLNASYSLTATRTATGERRNKAAVRRSPKRKFLRGTIHLPFRKMRTTFPIISPTETGESISSNASPRVCIAVCPGFAVTMRWATNLPPRLKATISPRRTSVQATCSTMSVSPGRIVGSILQPAARKRTIPETRNMSAASSRWTVCVCHTWAADLMKPSE
jgi:hypothetical protein